MGGIGAVLHGSPLPTNDLDVVPQLDLANLDALANALDELSAGIMSNETPEDILKVSWTGKDLRRWIVDFRWLNLMTGYGQLDLIYRPGGTRGYRDLARDARRMPVGDVSINVASLADIIRSKEAVARPRDLEQLQTLRMLLERNRDRES